MRVLALVAVVFAAGSCATPRPAESPEPPPVAVPGAAPVSAAPPSPAAAPPAGASPAPVPATPVAEPPPAPAFPPGAPAAAAKRLRAGGPDGVKALREAFAWAGIATDAGDGPTPARGRPQSFRISAREARLWARLAAGEPTLTVAQLGQLLSALAKLLGVTDPFTADERLRKLAEHMERGAPEPEDEEARERLEAELQGLIDSVVEKPPAPVMLTEDNGPLVAAEYVAALVSWARAHPGHPRAFGPLLVEASVAARTSGGGRVAANLAAREIDPQTLKLTLPEALLLLATPLSATVQGGLGAPPPRARYASLRGLPVVGQVPARPCSEFLGNEHPLEPAGRVIGDFGGGEALEYLLPMTELGGVLLEGALALIRLTAWLAETAQFGVAAAPTSAHYRHRESEKNEVTFTAKVTVETPEEPLSTAARDCLDYLGITVPDSRQAIAASMKAWKVNWNPGRLGGHATVSGKKNRFEFYVPTMGNKLQLSGNTGTTKLVVDMAEESDEADWKGRVHRGTMTMEASLDTSQRPDWGLLLKTAVKAKGNVWVAAAEGTLDIAVEALKQLDPQRASGTVAVQYHAAPMVAWKGTVLVKRTMRAEGRENQSYGRGVKTISGSMEDVDDITLEVAPSRSDERGTSYRVKKAGWTQHWREAHDGCANWKEESRTTWDYFGFGWETTRLIFDDDSATFLVQATLPAPTGKVVKTFKKTGAVCGKSVAENPPTERYFASPVSWGTGNVTCGGFGKSTDRVLTLDKVPPGWKSEQVEGFKVELECQGTLTRVDVDEGD